MNINVTGLFLMIDSTYTAIMNENNPAFLHYGNYDDYDINNCIVF